ncbi:MAG: hypothetical protein HY951_02820 [Bacteroidia bacterium]|nr:hypothetical protein [Bacteroidia bacterium]
MKRINLSVIFLILVLNAFSQNANNADSISKLYNEWRLQYNETIDSKYQPSIEHGKDRLIFSKDYKIKYKSGSHLLTGTWHFSRKDSSLEINGEKGEKIHCKLISLKDSLLILETVYPNIGSVKMHSVPVNYMGDIISPILISERTLSTDKYKFQIQFPYDPITLKSSSTNLCKVSGFQFEYADTTSNNLQFGAILFDYQNGVNSNYRMYDLSNFVKEYEMRSNVKYLTLDTIVISDKKAIKVTYYNKIGLISENVLTTMVFIILPNSCLNLYVTSRSELYGKKERENYFNAVKIK